MAHSGSKVGRISGYVLGLGVLAGCSGMGEDYAYTGVRQVASGPYTVEAVFSLEPAPIVMAIRQDPDEPSRMHLLGLSDARACVAGVVTEWLGAVDRRGFRLALRDAADAWRFYDDSCNEAFAVPDADGLWVETDRFLNQHRYLVLGTDRTLREVDPFEGTVRSLVTEIDPRWSPPYASSSLPLGEQGVSGAWVLRTEGRLQLVDFERGRSHLQVISDVREVGVRGGFMAGPVHVELLSMTHAEGVALRVAAVADGSGALAELWQEEGACAARFISSLGGCLDADCVEDADLTEAAAELSDMLGARLPDLPALSTSQAEQLVRVLPWLAMRVPCDSDDLVLRSIATSARVEVSGVARNYAVVSTLDEEGRALLYTQTDEEGESSYYAPLGGEAIREDVPLNFARTPDLLLEQEAYRLFTRESPPRLGLWRPEKGFETLIEDVATRGGAPVTSGALVLHDLAGDLGTLAYCEASTCADLASKVHQRRFTLYDTQPRIGESMEVVAFVRDVDPETDTGELVVLAPGLDRQVPIDTGVRTFFRVESGPARGIVYVVGDEARRGLWFAPR